MSYEAEFQSKPTSTPTPVAVLHPPLVFFHWSHLPLVQPPLVPLSTGACAPQLVSDWTGVQLLSFITAAALPRQQRQARGASEQLGGQRRGPASRVAPQICGLQGQRGQLGSRAQTSDLVDDPVRCGPVSPTVSKGSSSPSKEALEVLNLQTPQGAHR